MESATDLCPKCGYINSLEWTLCDACGERLPWAPPEPPKKRIADMSDEQLSTLFAPPPERTPLFLATRLGRFVVWIAFSLLLSSLWAFLRR